MTPLQWAIAVVVLVLAAFIARGMYLIGQGSDAELAARSKATDSRVVDSGWFLLDWLRDWDSPTLEYIEDKLGINQDNND